jgi:hypothetical protein
MKVKEGLQKWEIMKAYEEGEKIAWLDFSNQWVELTEGTGSTILSNILASFSRGYRLGVIEDIEPSIDWREFDWEFFNRYGGLPVTLYQGGIGSCFMHETPTDDELGDLYLRESPWYPWFGGKQPVPDNVEVEVTYITVYDRYNSKFRQAILSSSEISWQGNPDNLEGEIINFRLTGIVL